MARSMNSLTASYWLSDSTGGIRCRSGKLSEDKIGHFAGDAQGLTTAGQDANIRRGTQDLLCQMCAGLYKVLAIIEQDEHLLVAQIVAQHINNRTLRLVAQTNGNGCGPRDKLWVKDGSQLHQPDTIGKLT